jgi:hypothetical protein
MASRESPMLTVTSIPDRSRLSQEPIRSTAAGTRLPLSPHPGLDDDVTHRPTEALLEGVAVPVPHNRIEASAVYLVSGRSGVRIPSPAPL